MKKIVLACVTCAAAWAALSGGSSYTIDDVKGIVKDNSTGLYWMKCTMGNNAIPAEGTQCDGYYQRYRWEDAVKYCSLLDFGGRNNWRLPSVKELQSIVRYSNVSQNVIGFNPQVFPGTELNHYWTSTTHKMDPNLAWTIDFHYGNVTYQMRIDPSTNIQHEFYVRCVSGPDTP